MTLDKLGERIQEVAEAVASAHKCKAHVSLSSGLKEPYPPLVNNGWAWQLAKGVASSLFGEGNAVEIDTQMVGEDFAFIAEEIPSAMYLLGVRNESVGSVHPLHSSRFMLDGAPPHCSPLESIASEGREKGNLWVILSLSIQMTAQRTHWPKELLCMLALLRNCSRRKTMNYDFFFFFQIILFN